MASSGRLPSELQICLLTAGTACSLGCLRGHLRPVLSTEAIILAILHPHPNTYFLILRKWPHHLLACSNQNPGACLCVCGGVFLDPLLIVNDFTKFCRIYLPNISGTHLFLSICTTTKPPSSHLDDRSNLLIVYVLSFIAVYNLFSPPQP